MPRRVEWLLCATLFAAYAWFWQGGGWNQNSRFDQVRAIVEGRTFAINDFMRYERDTAQDGSQTLRLWTSRDAAPGRRPPPPNSLDLARVGDRFYPNKPPGVSMLAMPAYWLLDLARGARPETWWSLTRSAYLMSLGSVGLLGALSGGAFLRASQALHPRAPAGTHVAAALTFGLGTMMWPFATMLFDHVPVAALLLMAYALLLRTPDAAPRASIRLALAGLLCGAAVATNYAAILIVLPLMLRDLIRYRRPLRLAAVAAGGLLPAILLGAYHQVCFGRAWTIANNYQLEGFKSAGAKLFGVFNLPDFSLLWRLLFSDYRGLFITSPVLLAAVYGLWRMFRARDTRLDALTCGAAFAAFLLMNAAFNGWHGGFSAGPRYLIPALPFLCIGLAPVFARFPIPTALLAAASAAIMLIATAVDAQWPHTIQHPFGGYVWPLLRGGAADHCPTAGPGPVSASIVGCYENGVQRLMPRDGPAAEWSSFNLGEFLFPRSLASLLPLLALFGISAAALFRWLRPRGDAPTPP